MALFMIILLIIIIRIGNDSCDTSQRNIQNVYQQHNLNNYFPSALCGSYTITNHPQ